MKLDIIRWQEMTPKERENARSTFKEVVKIEKDALKSLPKKDRSFVMAVAKGDVKKAYLFLRLGANVNTKMTVGEVVYVGNGRSCVEAYDEVVEKNVSPLDLAPSDPMKDLIKEFGGKTSKELRPIWEKEAEIKERIMQEKQSKEEAKKEAKNAKKEKRDWKFVNLIKGLKKSK